LIMNMRVDADVKTTGYDPAPGFIFRFERFVTSRFLIRHLYSRFFSVDNSLCTDCGKCVKSCPVNNISKDKNNMKTWGRNCILCTQCEIVCPEKAISSPISWFIFTPFLKWNINRARKKKIPYKAVKI
jgi:MinD superfamily P-loop ATPase